ncbi:MAG: hypothetical protein AAF806_21850 [Bacteroidota bacterium]
MKNLLFYAIPLFILGLIFLSTSKSHEQPSPDFDTFSELMHNTLPLPCVGTSGVGGSCSAICSDRCDCICNSGLFKCRCACNCGSGNGGIVPVQGSIDPGNIKKWKEIRKIILEEKTEIAEEIAAQLMPLYKLGKANKVEEYDELSEVLDEKIMQLESTTVQKILSAVAS